MKIEITPQQQKALLNIISQAQIKGSEAGFVLELAQAITTPVDDNPKTDKEPVK